MARNAANCSVGGGKVASDRYVKMRGVPVTAGDCFDLLARLRCRYGTGQNRLGVTLLPIAWVHEGRQVELLVGPDVAALHERVEDALQSRDVERRSGVEHAVFFDVAEHADGEVISGMQLFGRNLGALLRIGPHEVATTLQPDEEADHDVTMGLSPFLVDIDAGELPVRNEIDSRAQIGETGCLGLVAVGDGLQADVDLALCSSFQRVGEPPTTVIL